MHPERTDIVEVLLAEGAFTDQMCSTSERPIHIASRKGNLSMTRLLVQHGANVNDDVPDTPLGIVAVIGSTECCDYLLSASANPNAPDKVHFKFVDPLDTLEPIFFSSKICY